MSYLTFNPIQKFCKHLKGNPWSVTKLEPNDISKIGITIVANSLKRIRSMVKYAWSMSKRIKKVENSKNIISRIYNREKTCVYNLEKGINIYVLQICNKLSPNFETNDTITTKRIRINMEVIYKWIIERWIFVGGLMFTNLWLVANVRTRHI